MMKKTARGEWSDRSFLYLGISLIGLGRTAALICCPGSIPGSGCAAARAGKDGGCTGRREVTLKGENGQVFLALWQENGCSCALSVTAGLGQKAMVQLLQSLLTD